MAYHSVRLLRSHQSHIGAARTALSHPWVQGDEPSLQVVTAVRLLPAIPKESVQIILIVSFTPGDETMEREGTIICLLVCLRGGGI